MPGKEPNPFLEVKDIFDIFRRTGKLGVDAFQKADMTIPQVQDATAKNTLPPLPSELAMFNQLLQGMGVISGTVNIGAGMQDMANGNYVDGGLRMASGVQTSAQNVASLAGEAGAARSIASVAPLIDGASAVNNFRKGDIAGGLRDTGSTVTGLIAPELAASWKIGWMMGTKLDGYAADQNLFGKHRKASSAAADSGFELRNRLERQGVGKTKAAIAGGYATLTESGINTFDSAMNTGLIPQLLLSGGADGDGPNPGALHMRDLSLLPKIFGGDEEEEATGPNTYQMLRQQIADTEALAQKQAGPHDGMY